MTTPKTPTTPRITDNAMTLFDGFRMARPPRQPLADTEQATVKAQKKCNFVIFDHNPSNHPAWGDDTLSSKTYRNAAQGHCLLKGRLDRALVNESRAGYTDADAPIHWLVLDNDGLRDLAPAALLALLGLADVDHIVQFSASAGIGPGKCGYHLFLLLDQAHRPADLKRMLKSWNLHIPALRAKLGLTRAGTALRWPLDIGVCQNDKLIYIAPPMLGPGVEDRLQGERIRLVTGTRRYATLAQPDQQDDTLRQAEQAAINRLRQAEGLPGRAFVTRKLSGIDLLRDPDQARVSGIKEERGFVYLNLNGGDSWGYYHPAHAPEVLYNFKGEPNYAIADLLPDYYPEARARAKEAQAARIAARQLDDMLAQAKALQDAEQSGEPVLLAFRDEASDQYLAGWLYPKNRSHAFNPIGNKGKINDLFAQHGQRKPEIIPTVRFRFEPANDALYDTSLTFINRFMPSRYLKEATVREDAALPPGIARVIRHALGGDDALLEHFLNWLAVLFRYRCRTESAWILQGTTGTGKGTLFSQIIRPLIGERYCRTVGLGNLEEPSTPSPRRPLCCSWTRWTPIRCGKCPSSTHGSSAGSPSRPSSCARCGRTCRTCTTT
jgi:hypothetical protein